jgi:predicted transcriptional regulator
MPHDVAEVRYLGELEMAVMEVMWARRTATVREVLTHLHRTPPPGYTTVATIMTRLVDKGLLQRSRSGKTDVYRPVYDREEFGRRVAMAAVRGLVDEFGDVALAQFAAALESADPDRLARLRTRCAQSPGEGQHA